MDSQIIFKYFPHLTDLQKQQFDQLKYVYQDWNLKINVVSRKDIDELYLRHVLHSLGIAKVIQFEAGSSVLDVGTGGGFPGIPLAILFPDVSFTLIDAVGKKIKVVQEVVSGLGLTNVECHNVRVETMTTQYDFVVSRAVAAMPTFVHWVKDRIKKKSMHEQRNGIFYLKGGDLEEELKEYKTVQIYNLSDFFEEEFFETKKVVYLPLKYRG
ncbi:16S rRNA (guanine(527)-N(7))-methyltransferase RsmG [Arenibacter sp. GZD96]|uniref:16S rRNA (guanine(527)-N(7))-methyltransferase RsmG n=1 Tax=Aurantibrevibacter litoralis TaxID=3106030 RepID=UPI002AFFD2C7|nr:16S rRNA (guanine(527)-N(7))-methyltransferase RsmG [Arenibacter sp. GZD-96]MEA1786718.1 16S rRNA (guanine(527)-N(7))-methyltransferase RsmG [Arenibacter sp. GZD-96]